jgi:acetyl esterase/lipase
MSYFPSLTGTRVISPTAFRAAAVAALVYLAAPPARAAEDTAAPAVQETLDVSYGDGDLQTLDVFSPKDARDCPVVLFVHGGAWVFGDKDLLGLYRGVGTFLARHGVTAMCVNYRLSPAVKHPGHVKDVARAFAWTRAHAGDYGGDPDRILLCGHSAGGHLVALLATDETYLKDPELKLTDADRAAVRGVMGVSGVYRVPTPDEFKDMMGAMLAGLAQMSGNALPSPLAAAMLRNSRDFNPFRVVFGDDKAAGEAASPLTHVHRGMPPFLVLYAERELPLVDGMARDFAKALDKAGDAVEIDRIAGCTHNTILFSLNKPDDPAAAALLPFIARYGGKAKSEAKP